MLLIWIEPRITAWKLLWLLLQGTEVWGNKGKKIADALPTNASLMMQYEQIFGQLGKKPRNQNMIPNIVQSTGKEKPRREYYIYDNNSFIGKGESGEGEEISGGWSKIKPGKYWLVRTGSQKSEQAALSLSDCLP